MEGLYDPVRAICMEDILDTMTMALRVRDLHFQYGKHVVLDHFNLAIPRGSIYGLLGPSGCGKTTLLKILLGQLAVPANTVTVFGKEPGLYGSVVPGPAVGYMPQELALEEELTVMELLKYYGMVYRMTPGAVAARAQWLMEFLSLPIRTASQSIKTLSGGQARRVSLCAALLHNPALLVLDEPTVGVDPMLRTRIWSCLGDLAAHGVTVIITTHYIEEARLADNVGLMRGGRLLAQDSPEQLIRRFNQPSLEDVFLQLCMQQDAARPDGSSEDAETRLSRGTTLEPLQVDSSNVTALTRRERHISTAAKWPPAFPEPNMAPSGATEEYRALTPITEVMPTPTKLDLRRTPSAPLIGAVAYRSFKLLQHNPLLVLFQMLLPAIQICLFCLAIGAPLRGLNFGVVNRDVGMSLGVNDTLNMGDSLVSHLDRSTFVLHTYNHEADAIRDVQLGHSWGVLSIPPTYTQDMVFRFVFHAPVTPALVWGSTVNMTLDMTDTEIYLSIEQAVQAAFTGMIAETAAQYKQSALSINPVSLQPPVYGVLNPRYTDFVAPGIMVSISFSLALGLTSISLVIDKKRKTLERAWSTGLRPLELMLGQFAVQTGVLLGQGALMYFCALVIFQLPLKGSLWVALAMTLLLGFVGMSLGLVISAIASSIEEATIAVLGTFFPVLLLSGVIWPLQGMPVVLQYISLAFPTTWAARVLRSVFGRGWGFTQGGLWVGFAVTAAWWVVLIFAASRALRRRV